jgi:hypothetical protein
MSLSYTVIMSRNVFAVIEYAIAGIISLDVPFVGFVCL